ncbi:alanine racemase [Zhihengliuella salsuginis]|uniref:Diaminopimelate decarboxylase n=1 Tax=Zhihengliuella salsuginis TaxID=578222 RepID=A0ABQ3GAE2_9MICC|nr:Y4yA family PLP-dependent enzyme [Zhihengliuella salsuginis]GHC99710.1 diaminopimelate decarboxylase [Zhihengliuella salsuginis]
MNTTPTPTTPEAPTATAPAPPDRSLCRGPQPLTARLEPWMEELLADDGTCRRLLAEHGSPVNVIDTAPLVRNIGELRAAAAAHGVDFEVYVARKANKAIAVVDAARDAGAGIDVASDDELAQVLERGVDPAKIILTSAVKPPATLRRALDAGVVVSLDNLDELDDLLAETGGEPADVALRLAAQAPGIRPTRFGLPGDEWLEALGAAGGRVRVSGVHFHLHGYAAGDRVTVLGEALAFVDRLREAGHDVRFVDIGGGIPMSYLDDRAEWDAFWAAMRARRDDLRGGAASGQLTWNDEPLGLDGSGVVYPFWQESTRRGWLESVLAGRIGGAGVAEALRDRGLQLRCEPGRSVLDGCGLTLSSVAFRKNRADGVPLVGLHMNRTQMRSTSLDVLMDPILVRSPGAEAGPEVDAYLVGAYCIEDELILRRRLRFPAGVRRDDVVAFPNTAGYLMHIVESASHQIPLAANVVRRGGGFERDLIDGRQFGVQKEQGH